MKKILYIDVPFSGMSGSDKRRSQYIWSILSRSYDADLLLIKTDEYLTKNIKETPGYGRYYSITAARPNPLKAKAVHQLSHESKAQFTQILVNGQYELIFFRLESCFELALITEKALPDCHLVMDIDRPFSRAALQLWQQNPVWKNKLQQIEYLRLKLMEKKLLQRPYQFIFSSNLSRNIALRISGLDEEKAGFKVIPNPLPESAASKYQDKLSDKEKALLDDKYILFYGNLNTECNLDAFIYLTKEIYPRVYKKLQEKDIKVYIVGKNKQNIHDQYTGGRIKLIGEVENILPYIKSCMFVILPMRIASAQGSRILETALLEKAILTTSKGIENYNIPAEDIAVCDKTDDFCNKLIQMVSKTEYTIDLGQNLFSAVTAQYNKDEIEKRLLAYLENGKSTGKNGSAKKKHKIALVTNYFNEEANYISRHILQQAKKLSEVNEVTVFCPKRNYKNQLQEETGFTVKYMFDVLNYPAKYPNHKLKTLCPSLLFSLLNGEFDLIQCYPGLNYNNTLAYLAAKIREIPIIQCFFSFIDYDKLIDETHPASRDLLEKTEVRWDERLVIKYLDYILAVSEKEYTFLRRINERIEHIPVPVDIREFTSEQPSVREKYGIDKDTFIFLVLGKFSYIKGQDIVLKAFTKALPALSGAKLIFVGKTDADPDFYEDMDLFIIREGIQEDLLIIGEAERNEVLAWLKEADILVIPARFMHVGTIVLESWASRTPVLQSDAVDPNLVIEDYNGYLFRSEDMEDLALQMQKAYKHRNRLPELAERGFVLVDENYSFDKLIDRYQKVYKRLLPEL